MRLRTSAQRSRPLTAPSKKSPVAKPPRPSQAVPWTLSLPSRAATEAFGQIIGKSVTGGETLALTGELGAGKTALVRGIATGLGTPSTHVTSPTFVLIHEYSGRLPLVHVDLYRLRSAAEAEGIGLQEYFRGETVTAIEWADKFPGLLPRDRLELTLEHRTRTARTVHLVACGPRASSLLAALQLATRLARRSTAARRSRQTAPKPGRARTS